MRARARVREREERIDFRGGQGGEVRELVVDKVIIWGAAIYCYGGLARSPVVGEERERMAGGVVTALS